MTAEWDFSLTERFFNISPGGASDPSFEMPASNWHLPSEAFLALHTAGRMYKAFGLTLPASFAGITLFNLVFTKLLFLAKHDRLLDLDLGNLDFQLGIRNGYVFLGYRIREVRFAELPLSGREQALEEHWRAYFADQINPAVDTMAAGAGVKPDLIWNQFGGRLAAMREYMAETESDAAFTDRLDRESEVLGERLRPEAFGRRKNPFHHRPRYVDNPWKPGGETMLRSACCMYDCREGGEKCYNCPRLTPEERERMKETILAAAAQR